ncbi:MAG: hypothetical protein QG623_225 [Patescibacteria group bacterium]|nr:hypothetical protein [Patescibacteria group bacterium]
MKNNNKFLRDVVAPLAMASAILIVGVKSCQDFSQGSMSFEGNDESVDQLFFPDTDTEVEQSFDLPACSDGEPGIIYDLELSSKTVTKIFTNPCDDIKPTVMGAYAECLVDMDEVEVIDYPYKPLPKPPETPKSDREILESLNRTEQACVVLARSVVPFGLQECIANRYNPYITTTTTTTIPEQQLTSTTVTTIPEQIVRACEKAVREVPIAAPAVAITANGKITG